MRLPAVKNVQGRAIEDVGPTSHPLLSQIFRKSQLDKVSPFAWARKREELSERKDLPGMAMGSTGAKRFSSTLGKPVNCVNKRLMPPFPTVFTGYRL